MGITDIGIFEQLSGLLICSGERPAILLLVVPSSLLLVHLDHIVLLHLQCLRSLVIVDSPTVEEETKGGDRNSHLQNK